MDLSLSIAIGSSVQIALFVAPVLLVSLALGPAPLDISIRPGLILCALASEFIPAPPVAGDEESNWLKDVAHPALAVPDTP